MTDKNYFVYITTNPRRTTLYVGVTNDLYRRMQEHFESRGNNKLFAGRFYCYNLLYFERFDNPTHAIDREKEIKKWSRAKKMELIAKMNPKWNFLNKSL